MVFAAQVERKPSHDFQFVDEIFRGNSHFGQLQVVDRRDGGVRYYLNDNLIQNTYDPARKQSESAFTYMLSLMAGPTSPTSTMFSASGWGSGSCRWILPGPGRKGGRRGNQSGRSSRRGEVFQFRARQESLVTIDDGRHYLNNCKKQYDAVVLDAFLGDSSPSHLMTREAFESIRRVLRPGGALVINCLVS